MAAPGGLEQWQKDGFFQAAEEVQESADLMESTYRTWVHERSSGANSEELNDLQRELQTVLGTAKWQLEQFERAVRLSNDKYSLEAGTVSRRRQFIVAIEDQISRVEKATNDSKIENGSRGLNWVKLDEDEQNDLVAFLSAPAQLSRETRKREGSYHSPPRQKNVLVGANNLMDMAGISKDRRTFEASPMEISNVESEVLSLAEQLNVHRTKLSSSDEHWKINIGDDKDDERKLSPKRVEVSSKTTTLSGILKGTEYLTRMRWLRNSLWKSKTDEHLPLRYEVPNQLDFRGVTLLAQRFSGLTERSGSCFNMWKENSRNSGRTGGLHIQGQQHSTHFGGRSIRITLLLYHFSSALHDKTQIGVCAGEAASEHLKAIMRAEKEFLTVPDCAGVIHMLRQAAEQVDYTRCATYGSRKEKHDRSVVHVWHLSQICCHRCIKSH